MYIGKIRYNVHQDWNEKRRRHVNHNPILADDEHAPIIDVQTWERAQVLLDERADKPNRVFDSEFPLTGLLRCPQCEAGMVIGRTVNKRKDESKRILEYYVCGAWKNKGTSACRSNGVRRDYADKFVLTKVTEILKNEKLLKDIINRVNKDRLNRIGPAKRELDALQKEVERVQATMKKYMTLYEEDSIPGEELSTRLAELKEEKRLLEERMTPLRLITSQGSIQPISYKFVKDIMKNFYAILNNVATQEQRKKLLHLLISEITVDKERKIETIKIKVNEGMITYLTKGEGLSLVDGPSPLSFGFTEMLSAFEAVI